MEMAESQTGSLNSGNPGGQARGFAWGYSYWLENHECIHFP